MNKASNYLILLLIAAIWGSGFIVTKNSINEIGVYSFLAMRFIVATIPLAIIVFTKKYNVFENWKLGLFVGISHFLIYAPQTIGLQFTTPSNSAFITGLFVVFTPLIAFILLKDKPKKLEIIAALLCLMGIWILTGGIQNLNIGDLITIFAAIANAALIVLTAQAIKKGSNIFVLTFQQFFFTSIFSLFFAISTRSNYVTTNLNTYLVILYLGIFASSLAFLFLAKALKKLDSTVVAIIVSTEPLFALLFSWIFQIEAFNPYKLIGGIIIFFSIILPSLNLDISKSNKTIFEYKFIEGAKK